MRSSKKKKVSCWIWGNAFSAENVQKAVIADVEKITGMTVTTVHVLIQDIDDETYVDDEEDNGEI